MPLFARYPVPSQASDSLTDSFKRKRIPGTSRDYARGLHGGIDIGGDTGNAVRAVKSGKVVGTGNVWGPSYGHQVLIRHRFWQKGRKRFVRRYSFYAHLNKITVSEGERVKAGALIGRLGNTGQSSGPHVHFEWHTTPEWTQGLRNPWTHLEEARANELKRK